MKRTIPQPTPIGLIMIILFLSLQIVGRVKLMNQDEPDHLLIPLVETERVIEKVLAMEVSPDKTTEEIIEMVFGDEADMAKAVAQAECRGYNNDCLNVWEKEHSVGMFQINILAHWAKIPGRTLTEKETWLKDPLNNTLMAKIVKDMAGGWTPWTGFTSGNYKNYLE